MQEHPKTNALENNIAQKPIKWPTITSEARPWTRWWWLGSAVDKQTITRLLETYREAGIGGVEITSIYGVKGQEDRNIEYLSPEWIEMVRHTIQEAKRLEMQVDLPPGSGWRMGGDFITDETSGAELKIEKSETGTFSLRSEPTTEPVKRPGPGGAGRAFNPFSRKSLQAVIDHFTPPFKDLDIRAQFHDSWEYMSDCCPELFEKFREKRGYDLQEHAAELAGEGDPENISRVRYDYRLTIAELALEDFIQPWTEWCHELGQQSRNQAHGSPGNLLDLYAAADIPETEVFRSITDMTPLISKFASSAAHVGGKKLVSSETGTWFKEHFNTSLGDMKQLVDNLFVSGINHHVYHGTCYSPADADWPGWLFYASAQLNPQNPIWRDFDALNAYIARCQSVLQGSQPHNDLLIYFPFHDLFHKTEYELAKMYVIEDGWMDDCTASATIYHLWRRGYAFDYISDRQLQDANPCGSSIDVPGGRYKVLLVPTSHYMPVQTMERLKTLADSGANVIFMQCAEDVPGLHALEKRRERLLNLRRDIDMTEYPEDMLEAVGVQRETLVDHPGLNFIRRRRDDGIDYFIVNEGCDWIGEWIRLAVDYESVTIMDPMSGRIAPARLKQGDRAAVRLELAPGESLILRTLNWSATGDVWPMIDTAKAARELTGTWEIDFLQGGPELPPAFQTKRLASWTEQGAEAERFAGTACYRITFDAPSVHKRWILDLGKVFCSARVRLNARDLGTLIGPSFQIVLEDLEAKGNLLDIEVTNLAANRIRDLDRRGIEWRIFEDINFVTRHYEPFDASDWPVAPSGLLGPVWLIPVI